MIPPFLIFHFLCLSALKYYICNHENEGNLTTDTILHDCGRFAGGDCLGEGRCGAKSYCHVTVNSYRQHCCSSSATLCGTDFRSETACHRDQQAKKRRHCA